MRLLIADDDRGGANTLAILLRREGFQVEVAYDGQKAVEAALAFDPDVFILDLNMPALDGFQTIRRLRAMPQFDRKRFVALTSYSDQAHMDDAARAHFDDYLVKPCELDVLRKILSEAAATAGE
jgi:DNA-binding response OmpR family regulator